MTAREPSRAPRSPRVEWVAHRGESADAPENTLAAFRLAWDRHADAIELDVQLSSDDHLVVIHDANTLRTTRVSRLVRESTLAELRALDAGRWKGPEFAGERLPTLGEVLATIPDVTGSHDRARALVEIKVGPEAVPALVEAVHASGKAPAQVAIISFHADTLAESKRRLPALKHYFLADLHTDETTGVLRPTAAELIALAHDLQADGLDLGDHELMDRAFVEQVETAGLDLAVWTVDDPRAARRLIAAGVPSITTNKASWMRAQIANESGGHRSPCIF